MTEKENQREKDYWHGRRFKKKADIEYTQYKKCLKENKKNEAKLHLSNAKSLYAMYETAFHRAGYVIPS